jgi:hypothetical protein
LSHGKQRVREIIERLAQPPNVSMLVEHEHGEIAWPMRTLQSQMLNVEGRPIAFAEAPDTLALFAWLHRDQLIKQLHALVAEEADDGAALSIAARQT